MYSLLKDRLWLLLLNALRNLGPGGQCSDHFPVPSHKLYLDQRSGRDPQPVPRGWTDPAVDISIFESAGSHREEVRGREDHGELQEAQSNRKLSQLPILRVDQVLGS